MDELPAMFGLLEMEDLAQHFSIDQDSLLVEWTGLCDILQEQPRSARTLDGVYKHLCAEEFKHLGLQAQYPLLTKLYAIALTVPMSTAEVERIFSQLSLIKTNHRNRMKEETLQKLLNVKLNMKKVNLNDIIMRSAVYWLTAKERRIMNNIS